MRCVTILIICFLYLLSPPSDPLCVLERVLDLDVPVQGDGAEAQDGGGGAHNVRACHVFCQY